MSMGERIKLIRKRNNLTQVQLADILDLKQATIGKYENSSITPSFLVLLRISRKFRVDIGWLLTDEKKNEEQETKSTKFKCPSIVKNAKVLPKGKQFAELSAQYKKENNSVKRRIKIVHEINELRNVAQDLMDRIILLQEEMKKGL
ncbi:MAG: helix-turn-helix transcriptional regulator [Candidatus Tenebribacter davisii]|nr:helix-turn-helix transcriptional regulator [Candidatus Tenebribacter davisii]